MLAVIGAMKEQIDALAAEMAVSERKMHAGIDVVRGHFGEVELVLAQWCSPSAASASSRARAWFNWPPKRSTVPSPTPPVRRHRATLRRIWLSPVTAVFGC